MFILKQCQQYETIFRLVVSNLKIILLLTNFVSISINLRPLKKSHMTLQQCTSKSKDYLPVLRYRGTVVKER
jgi:hypothetical protein